MKNKPSEEMPQGEGNRAADRRYRAGVAETIQSGKVPEKAEEARRDVEREGLSPQQAQKPQPSDPRNPQKSQPSKSRPSDSE